LQNIFNLLNKKKDTQLSCVYLEKKTQLISIVLQSFDVYSSAQKGLVAAVLRTLYLLGARGKK
jgi:hypothetical protein